MAYGDFNEEGGFMGTPSGGSGGLDRGYGQRPNPEDQGWGNLRARAEALRMDAENRWGGDLEEDELMERQMLEDTPFPSRSELGVPSWAGGGMEGSELGGPAAQAALNRANNRFPSHNRGPSPMWGGGRPSGPSPMWGQEPVLEQGPSPMWGQEQGY